jgi:primosomal protein N' (replication factor Y)
MSDAPRAVRVVTEVAAVDREFDYLVTDATATLAVGDRVRVNLHGRSVRGWVVDEAPVERELKPVAKSLGKGPSPAVVDLARWAADLWMAPLAKFLTTATPPRIYHSLPTVPPRPQVSVVAPRAPGTYPWGAAHDPLEIIESALMSADGREGSVLLLVPTDGWARRLVERCRRRGWPVAGPDEWDKQRAGWPLIVGTRGDAFSPTPRLAAAVVIDADDDAYISQAAPTWNAVSVVAERCRRDDAALFLLSPVPSPHSVAAGAPLQSPDDPSWWPIVDIVDRRLSDPRDGVLSSEIVSAAHRCFSEGKTVVVVSQRLGAGRINACKACGELATCETCGRLEDEVSEGLRCSSCEVTRESFCRACGRTAFRRVQQGVSTLARDVGLLLGREALEVTAATSDIPEGTLLVVGTEAVFPRLRRAGLVVMADFDQYLLAPRERARRDALSVVAKAGRLVGPRRDAHGRVMVQTRRNDDDVLRALRTMDVSDVMTGDAEIAELLHLPPFATVIEISGEGRAELANHLRASGFAVSDAADVSTVRGVGNDLRAAIRGLGRRENVRLAVFDGR